LGEAARVGVDFAELPADLVILPAFGEVAGAELGEGEVVADAGMAGIELKSGLVGLEGVFDAAEAQEGVAAVAGGGFVAFGFGLLEGLDGLVEEVAWAGVAPRSQRRDRGHPRCLFCQEEDSADVGDFWVGLSGVVGALGGFGALEGLVGRFELILFEMEVGEGNVDFRLAGRGFGLRQV
jgi:hypothetical protein